MSHHALLEYVRNAKDCGASDHEIAERLHKAGWYRVDVQDALELYHRIVRTSEPAVCEPTPRPGLADRLVPRAYDPHIIAVAAVAFAVGLIGYLWFAR